MKATVHVMLKGGVLDPQGKAIEHALHAMGFDEVEDVRQGKIIAFEVPEGMNENTVQDMCEKLLANPVIEDYQIKMAA